MKSMGLKEQKKFGILFLAVGAALFIVGLALGDARCVCCA